ncbi:unnamed protein product [Trypanosoma congolense IL3000]|uniref:WGS project CAEQ00000000 data, annotated contig 1075 n=1 Tax=Trypanosoma congolense (strain IL3000) TaxID=1068625 RepID=F9W3L9_TRYCI|nr:unnamed protein product [Trypanosoma congolense IL3000]
MLWSFLYFFRDFGVSVFFCFVELSVSLFFNLIMFLDFFSKLGLPVLLFTFLRVQNTDTITSSATATGFHYPYLALSPFPFFLCEVFQNRFQIVATSTLQTTRTILIHVFFVSSSLYPFLLHPNQYTSSFARCPRLPNYFDFFRIVFRSCQTSLVTLSDHACRGKSGCVYRSLWVSTLPRDGNC